MKKSFLMFAAGFGLLSLASCSNDDMPAANKDGGVTFTLRIPEEALTRVDPVASGAGTMATNIHYAVYKHGDTTPLIVDKACNLSDVYKGPDAVYTSIDDITLTLQLADNVNYDIVFFATSDSPAYVYNYATQEISLGSNLEANQESYDAFYAAVSDFTTKKSEGNISVTLTRPFAQLNIGTNDLSNPTVPAVATSSVTITKVPASLNLLTGQASEVTDVTAPVVFGSADLPSGYKFPVNGYSNLAMVYVLAGGNESNSPSTLSTVTLNTTPEEGKYSMSWDNVPLRTNYRTNIFGSLFTSQTNFKITIEPIFSGEYPDPWDGTTVLAVTPQTTTIDGQDYSVYEIYDPAQLAYLTLPSTTLASNAYIRLSNDINLDEKAWTPFGNVSRSGSGTGGFTGVFDGNGHTIYGLVSTGVAEKNMGAALINVSYNATVKNLNIDGATVAGPGDYAGAIVGASFGTLVLDNCHVTNATVTAGDKAGGLVGRAYGTQTTISDCSFSGTVTGAKTGGGIVGILSNGANHSITNCVNNGTIKGGAAGTGGIAGYVGVLTTFTDCVNNGTVGNGTDKYAGGIEGYANGHGDIFVNCSNTGAVKGQSAGGIVGALGGNYKPQLSGCTNSGSVTGNLVGGMISSLGYGEVENCSNYGVLNATKAAGGIAGNGAGGTITNCYGGTSEITAPTKGRIVGYFGAGPNNPFVLSLLADSGSLDGLLQVGSGCIDTSLSKMTVVSGELIGNILLSGASASYITIKEGASWSLFPGETGTWVGSSTTGWTKQ